MYSNETFVKYIDNIFISCIVITQGGLMRKRTVIISLVIAILVTTPVFLYFYFRPKSETPKSDYSMSLHEASVEYDEFIHNYSHETGKQLIYLSCDDKDSKYVINSVLTPLSIKGDGWLPEISLISLKDYKDMTVTQLKDRFNVERTPSFIVYEVDEKGKIKILSTLTHYDNEPITEKSLTTWLVTQNLWNGPYDEE